MTMRTPNQSEIEPGEARGARRIDVALALALALVLGVGLGACAAPAEGERARVESLSETDALAEPGSGAVSAMDESSLDDPSVGTAISPRYLTAAPEFVLDQRDDGATLTGRPEPALADSDPERVLVLVAEIDGRPIDAALEGARVLDARFVGEAIVTLGADHVLRSYLRGSVATLDDEVEPPLSVAGTAVAYARGQMPSFELARIDLGTGVARALTDDMAPVWSPALSPDGLEIVFVSGATGTPRLYRIGIAATGGAGVAEPLADVGTFPSSPRAPRWDETGELTFEDEAGARHVVDLATGALVR